MGLCSCGLPALEEGDLRIHPLDWMAHAGQPFQVDQGFTSGSLWGEGRRWKRVPGPRELCLAFCLSGPGKQVCMGWFSLHQLILQNALPPPPAPDSAHTYPPSAPPPLPHISTALPVWPERCPPVFPCLQKWWQRRRGLLNEVITFERGLQKAPVSGLPKVLGIFPPSFQK